MLTSSLASAAPSITIYNGDFAVVRDTILLKFKPGVNSVSYQDITQNLEPNSVVLRPVKSNAEQWPVNILEQNYLSSPVDQSLLLEHFEGQTIDFEVQRGDKTVVLPGKIIRSGKGSGFNNVPIIELDGKSRFGLPGVPLFPAIKNDAILKPTLQWQLESAKAGTQLLELAYLTAGLSWKADYNMVASADGEEMSVNAWITFSNRSGKAFEQAKMKMMAGDINKISPDGPEYGVKMRSMVAASAPQVTEKDFDEYHLYSIERAIDLQDGETKQISFINSKKVKSSTVYIYDGALVNRRYQTDQFRSDPDYGTQSNTKVSIRREFKNSKDNGLGIPLPKGRVRFYQQDEDNQLEFIGENNIDHTPTDNEVSLYTGNAFDLKGERKRMDFQVNTRSRDAAETFEITVKNSKKTDVRVNIVEHLYRWNNWKIENASEKFVKKDSHTIEFPVQLKAGEEVKLSYKVNYSW